MTYCYHCITQLSKDYKVCPHCNKTLDLERLKGIYRTEGSAAKESMRIWLSEHSRMLMPILTLVIGVGIGIALWMGYAQARIIGAKTQDQAQISTLQAQVAKFEEAQEASKAAFASEMTKKDSVISLLNAQKETAAKLIYFTRRMARGAQIVPSSTEERDYYKRNSLYWIRVFGEYEETLAAAGYPSKRTYDMQAIPELLAETDQTADLISQ